MPNPMGMGMGMSGQMQPPQGNNPWPSPMEGLRALLGIVDPGVVEMNAFNDQGQFDPRPVAWC